MSDKILGAILLVVAVAAGIMIADPGETETPPPKTITEVQRYMPEVCYDALQYGRELDGGPIDAEQYRRMADTCITETERIQNHGIR